MATDNARNEKPIEWPGLGQPVYATANEPDDTRAGFRRGLREAGKGALLLLAVQAAVWVVLDVHPCAFVLN